MKGTEEELEQKRLTVKFSIDGIVMKEPSCPVIYAPRKVLVPSGR